VKKILVEKRINEIINRLNKTRVEKFPDLAAEKAEFEKEERRKEKAELQEKVSVMIPCFFLSDVLMLSALRGNMKSELQRKNGTKQNWK